MLISFLFKIGTYPEIGKASFKCEVWTFKQQLTLKCKCIVEFLLFSYKRLCTVAFRMGGETSQKIYTHFYWLKSKYFI